MQATSSESFSAGDHRETEALLPAISPNLSGENEETVERCLGSDGGENAGLMAGFFLLVLWWF